MNRAPGPVIAGLVALVLAACGTNQPATPAGPGLPTYAIGASGGATAAPPATFGPPPSPTPPGNGAPVAIDPELLAFLPETVDGVALVEDLDVVAEGLGNDALTRIASGVTAAVAADPASGNLVTVWVVRLRPGGFGEELYRQWRDSFDEGACGAGGGITGRAQAELGGRNTYVTSCVAAFRTYHAWLEEQNVLASASSIGEGRFGEKLMSTLRVPE